MKGRRERHNNVKMESKESKKYKKIYRKLNQGREEKKAKVGRER